MSGSVWIFGYGSLIWRPAFEFHERRPAHIVGFARRFWQDSPDHRGTPEAPGRVVTLIEMVGARCDGVAYRIGHADSQAILAALDHREQGGYVRVETTIHLAGGPDVPGVSYVAAPGNPHYAGPTAIEDIARLVRERSGPSGTNLEYVIELARELEALGAIDDHLRELVALL